MIWAALRLHEATNDQRYFEQALAWVDVLDKHYWVEGKGGYATSADDTRDVIVRLRPGTDDAAPNAERHHAGQSHGAGDADGRPPLRGPGERACWRRLPASLGRNIVAYTGLLASTFDLLAPQQVVVAGQHLDGWQRV